MKTGATCTPYYYHADGLGSITSISNASGAVVQRYAYDSFGNMTITTNGNINQPYTYTSREYDKETGMYFYRARYYDPKAGRFVTKDPIGFAGGDVNLYAYTKSRPINLTDPSGNTPAGNEYDDGIGISWVNPFTYWSDLYSYAHSSRSWGHNQYNNDSSMRHCVVSCMVASKFGNTSTRLAGVANEIQGFILYDIPDIGGRISGKRPWAFEPRDLIDNERGIRCSKRNENNFDENDIRKSCIQGCQSR
ncbi:MAG: RHS repeat-associated core domain-containing protein [Dehalococcoidales bacterium]|nr:RHS repeat-associated core domain-containing protein [Dehalococcoidales bacterium]